MGRAVSWIFRIPFSRWEKVAGDSRSVEGRLVQDLTRSDPHPPRERVALARASARSLPLPMGEGISRCVDRI